MPGMKSDILHTGFHDKLYHSDENTKLFPFQQDPVNTGTFLIPVYYKKIDYICCYNVCFFVYCKCDKIKKKTFCCMRG